MSEMHTSKRAAARFVLLCFDVVGTCVVTAPIVFGLATPAYAYVDPSVMTYTIQALAAVAVALSAVLGVAFRRTRKALLRLFHLEDAGRTTEAPVHRIDPSQKGRVDAAAARELATSGTGASGVGKGAHFTKERIPWPRRLIVALLVSVFTALTLFVVAPLELMAGSASSLLFGVKEAWQSLVLAGLVISVALGILLSFIRGRAFSITVAVVLALGVGAWLQAMFMNSSLPVADGDLVDWTKYTGIMLLSLVVWLAVVIGFVMFARKNGRTFRVVAGIVSVALVVVQGAGVVSIINEANGAPERVTITQRGLFDVSPKNNVICFVLDMTDTKYALQAYADHPDLLDGFDGFTWYQNCTGSMIPTRYGIPSLLTGHKIQPAEDAQEYLDTMYTNSHFLDDVKAQGYTTDIYSDSANWQENWSGYLRDRADNFESTSEIAQSAYDVPGALRILYQCALYRDLPWIAKPFFWFYTDQLNQGMTKQGEGADDATPYVIDDPQYFAQLSERGLTTNNEEASFRFIHLMGTHWPYTMDADANKVPESGDWESQLVGSFKIVRTYLEQLKSLGLYDNTTVIVTADHGEWTIVQDGLSGTSAPILFVKPAQSSTLDAQPCAISQQPVSHYDLQATMLKAMGAGQDVLNHYGEYNQAIEDRHDPANRSRYYLATTSDGHNDTSWMEYEIRGDANDWRNWRFDGNRWSLTK